MPKITKEEIFDYVMLHKWPYWASALTVGFVAIGFAGVVAFSESFADRIFEISPAYFFIISPLFFLISWALVYFFAPEAKGSGIPQVMAAVEIIEKNQSPEKV